MEQTPAHDTFNPEVLKLMRPDLNCVVEVGASYGGLARAYRNINPTCHYVGVEIDPSYAQAASQHCSEVITGNIEHFTDEQFINLSKADCWVFADVLEHLYDPWKLLQKIKQHAQQHTEIVTCIPNSQHWSLQALLCAGKLQYQNNGLLDKTHIRFFSRETMNELFNGYKILDGVPLMLQEEVPETVFLAIKSMAQAIGANPEQAVADSIPYQWTIRAVTA